MSRPSHHFLGDRVGEGGDQCEKSLH